MLGGDKLIMIKMFENLWNRFIMMDQPLTFEKLVIFLGYLCIGGKLQLLETFDFLGIPHIMIIVTAMILSSGLTEIK